MSLISRDFLKKRPQELGKIKIGRLGAATKSRQGNEFRRPEKLDHFIVTTRTRGKDGNFEKDERIHGHEKVGPTPTELAGFLMFEAPEENLHTEMVEYRGRTKVVSCDGETRTDTQSGACSECPRLAGKECKCKPYGRLHIQLLASPDTLGFHVLRTTSWETVNNLQSALEDIYERFGTLYHAPVILKVYPAEDTYTEDGQSKTSKSWKVGLVLAMSMEQAARRMIEAKQTLDETRQALGGQPLQITARSVRQDLDDRDILEADAIGEEFFPPEEETSADRIEARLQAIEESEAEVIDVTPPEEEVGGFTEEEQRQLDEALLEAQRLRVAGDDAANDIAEATEAGDAERLRTWLHALRARVNKALDEQAAKEEAARG